MLKQIDYENLPYAIKRWGFLDTIIAKSSEYNLDPYHIIALVITESSGNPSAIRYEPTYKWTFEIDSFAKKLGCTGKTMEVMQKTSWGLCQVMGGVFMELGGYLSQTEWKRWPTALLNPTVGLDFGCRFWAEKSKYYPKVDKTYAAYNAGSVRYDQDNPENLVNQKAVDRFCDNLHYVTQHTRF